MINEFNQITEVVSKETTVIVDIKDPDFITVISIIAAYIIYNLIFVKPGICVDKGPTGDFLQIIIIKCIAVIHIHTSLLGVIFLATVYTNNFRKRAWHDENDEKQGGITTQNKKVVGNASECPQMSDSYT